MRAIAAFIAVNLLFFCAAAVGAVTILGLGKAMNATPLANDPLGWIFIGFAGLATTIGSLWAATRLIGRRSG